MLFRVIIQQLTPIINEIVSFRQIFRVDVSEIASSFWIVAQPAERLIRVTSIVVYSLKNVGNRVNSKAIDAFVEPKEQNFLHFLDHIWISVVQVGLLNDALMEVKFLAFV